MQEQIQNCRLVSNFVESLRKQQAKVVKTSVSTATTEQFIQMLLKQNDLGLELTQFVKSNRKIKRIFERIKDDISENISPKNYLQAIQEAIDDLSNVLQDQFYYRHEIIDGESELNVSIIPKKPIQLPPKQQEIINPSKFNSKIHTSKIQKSNLQKSQIPKKPFPLIEDHHQPKQQVIKNKMQIKTEDLIVELRYLISSVDYEKYQYNNFSLKQSMQNFICKYLSQNIIIVRNQVQKIKILEEIQFIKSKDAGNYRFNPLFDAIEIWLKKTDNSHFNFNFTVTGEFSKLNIVNVSVLPEQWNKAFMKLNPKSSIDELVHYICQKKQASSSLAKGLTESLKKIGGANIVEDLFKCQRSDYAQMKVKPTYAFQIQQAIQQIKDNPTTTEQKKLDKYKMNCLIIANSHKILRYVVYKLGGINQVSKISWLNMENLQNAIQIVRSQIHNDQLLDQLQGFFDQYALDPQGRPLELQRGLILYGPPGTGKTVITQALPNIIGFHLIEKGLSAADFMKSLVGQSSRMIKDLTNRAAVSPYLLCSVGIDEVDGLVPDRKDKQQKNKGEGISIILSVVGGNKDVPNLVFMTSTNYIKKIDEAVGRRFSGKFQVGRPNPTQRMKIILSKVQYFRKNKQNLDHLIRITTNFTGAALCGLANILQKSLKIKKKKNEKLELSKDEITEGAIIKAKQFDIMLGGCTLPEIYRSQQQKNHIFTQRFLKRISNRFLSIKHIVQNEFKIMYANEIKKFVNGKLNPIYELQEDKLTIDFQIKDKFDLFTQYIQLIFENKNYVIRCFKPSKEKNYNKYLNQIKSFLQNRKINTNGKTILIIQDHPHNYEGIDEVFNLFMQNSHNMYLLYYILPQKDVQTICEILFGLEKSKIQNRNLINITNYTGRIMVEINQETRMAFQLRNCMQQQSKIAFRHFLKVQDFSTSKTAIPQLVDFFTKQEVSYILLIDYSLITKNNAFDQSKVMQVLEQKMLEAKGYKKSAVIIDIDSIITLNQNVSDSSFGRNTSYSIQNFSTCQILLSYMNEFASTFGGESRWITMIVKHPELLRILKKQLSWPKYPQEIQKQIQQEQLNKERICYRCGIFYTERQNKKQRKCMQHPGIIINTHTKLLEDQSLIKLKALNYLNKKKKNKSDENLFIYACCLKGLDQPGQKAYFHITQNQKQENELQKERQSNSDKWKQVLEYLNYFQEK